MKMRLMMQVICYVALCVFLVGTLEEAYARGGGGRGGGGFSRSGPAASGGFSSQQQSVQPRQSSRQQTSQERQSSRSTTTGDRQDDRQQHQDASREDRQQQQNENREDWQDYGDNHHDDDWDHDDDFAEGVVVGAVVVGAAAVAIDAANPDTTVVYADSPGYLSALPCSPTVVDSNGMRYYLCGSTWYSEAYAGGSAVYVTTAPPPGY